MHSSKPLISDKWIREEILDAYLQPFIMSVKKITAPTEYGRSVIKTRLVIEWLEEDG